MSNMKQLGALVTPSHKETVEKLAEENSWSVNETVRNAIEALAGLSVLHRNTAEMLGPELGPLWVRLVREFGPVHMVNKPLKKATFDDGKVGLLIDEYGFTLEDDGRLLATRQLDGYSEIYEVENGLLVTKATFPATTASLN